MSSSVCVTARSPGVKSTVGEWVKVGGVEGERVGEGVTGDEVGTSDGDTDGFLEGDLLGLSDGEVVDGCTEIVGVKVGVSVSSSGMRTTPIIVVSLVALDSLLESSPFFADTPNPTPTNAINTIDKDTASITFRRKLSLLPLGLILPAVEAVPSNCFLR